MLRIYKTNEEEQIEKIKEIEKDCWIDLVSPTKEEIERVVSET